MWAMGLKAAAIARLCAMPDNFRAMPDICQRYMPRERVAYAAAITPVAGSTPGRIELVDGKTGAARWCDDYDPARRHCRRWAVLP
jgi:hypothetical protein